jgi:tetratricopeptide (TPR) repeat protein
VIQFPQGMGPAQPVVPETGQSVLPAGRMAAPHASVSHTPADTLTLQTAAVAALELELLQHWDDGPLRAAGEAEYQLGRAAAATGDHAATLQHLEQSILADPANAQAAQRDPAFDAMRGDVRDMAGRLNVLARIRAEGSIAEAGAVLESARGYDAGRLQHAQAYLDLAQAHFESVSYAGYVVAAQAAAMAQQSIAGSKLTPPDPIAAIGSKTLLGPLTHAARKAARRLWQTLPLLAILLGWLFAGILAGIASLPFQQGAIAELRQTLFPIWAMGLLGMVLLGFVRSIRRIGRRF